MTSYNYGPLASKAVQLIAKFGSQVTLTLTSDPEAPADASKPWRGPAAASVSYLPKGVVSSFDKKDIDGDLIRSSDQALLIAGQDPEVLRLISAGRSMDDIGFVETTAGGRMAALNLTPIVPGDTVMLYTVRLRLG